MRPIRFAPFVLAVALAACGTTPEKFPYPPQFVTPEQVTVHTLPAPPQPGSAKHKAAINEIIALQAALTDEQIAAIRHEVKIAPQMLVEPVLGEEFTPESFPALYSLLKRAGSDAWRINDMIQDHWKETRPWLADTRVKRYVEEIYRPGYPSGHTVTNHVWAHILADLMPCQEDALFARAGSVGWNRVLGGAHFPHDVEAGKKLATVIYHRMLENPEFREARLAARHEIERSVRYGIPSAEAEATDTGFIARCAPQPRPEPLPAL